MKFAFFKTGTHTAKNGKKLKADKSTLQQIIDATRKRDYADDSFPLTIGHPQDDSPAVGWVKKDAVSLENGLLHAFSENESLIDGIKDMIEKKMYKNVSVKLRPDLSIRHIALLGAQPPAITGLPAIEFGEDEEGIEFEFGEFEVSKFTFTTIENLLRNIKNWFIESEGLEAADKLLPEHLLQEAGNPPYVWEKKTNEFSEDDNNNINSGDDLVTKIKVGDKEFNESDITAALEAKKESDIKLAEMEAEQNRSAARAKALEFCEGDDVKDRLKPALRNQVVEALTDAELNNTTLEFSEGDKTVKVSQVEVIQNLVKELPEMEFEEMIVNGESGQSGEADTSLAEEAAKEVNEEL